MTISVPARSPHPAPWHPAGGPPARDRGHVGVAAVARRHRSAELLAGELPLPHMPDPPGCAGGEDRSRTRFLRASDGPRAPAIGRSDGRSPSSGTGGHRQPLGASPLRPRLRLATSRPRRSNEDSDRVVSIVSRAAAVSLLARPAEPFVLDPEAIVKAGCCLTIRSILRADEAPCAPSRRDPRMWEYE